jgi:hypothetical protein
MEAKNNAGQSTTTGRVGATAPTRFQLLFGMREVCDLTQLARPTLKNWIIRGWVRPVGRSKGGRGREHQFTAWQTVGLSILSAALRSAESAHTQVGRVGVVSAMQRLAELDDALLLSEAQGRDPHAAEEVAAAVARAASPELPCECLEAVARVVRAIDRKVSGLRERTTNRLR